jgi:hypothetical protein
MDTYVLIYLCETFTGSGTTLIPVGSRQYMQLNDCKHYMN